MLYVDSSFWIAQVMERDSRASDAARLAEVYEGESLATSNLVVGETWSFLRRREGHRRAMLWLDRLRDAARVSIERVTPELEGEAWAWLRIHDERPYSFVDATSFALMRRLGIRDALAFDGDFAAAGFTELRP
ncbi:MAG TPA: PIN domain-containing protein [Gaiellaceae bacterium]|nr:PIN domain-containing protein [Gaiellaceae bacterium]